MLNKFKIYMKLYFIFGLLIITSACATATKEIYIAPGISNSTLSYCKEPQSVLTDLSMESVSELNKLNEEDIDKRVLTAYKKNKLHYIECYREIIKTKNTYTEIKTELIRTSDKK